MTCIGRTRRIFLFWVAAALIASVEAVLTAGWLVGATSPRVFSSVNDVPARAVGIPALPTRYCKGQHREPTSIAALPFTVILFFNVIVPTT